MYSIKYIDLINILSNYYRCKDIDKQISLLGYLELLHAKNIESKPLSILRDLLSLERLLKRKTIIENNDNIMEMNKQFMLNEKKVIEHIIPNFEYKEEKVSFDNKSASYLLNILEGFFNSLSPSLLSFYKKLSQNKQIFFVTSPDKNYQKRAFSINDFFDDNKKYVYIYRFNNMHDLSTLIHEIGHAYYNYLNSVNCYMDYNVDFDMKIEILSILLEALFINYLKYIHLDNDALMLEKDFFNDLKYYRNNMHQISDIRYLIGFYVGYTKQGLINRKYTLEEFIDYIYHTHYLDLISFDNVRVLHK